MACEHRRISACYADNHSPEFHPIASSRFLLSATQSNRMKFSLGFEVVQGYEVHESPNLT